MKATIQRVSQASVEVNNNIISSISHGMLILLGIGHNDTDDDIEWLCKKICSLRIFNDDDGVMNKSIIDTDGSILLISQFTLMAKTKKGNRPSYIDAAKPDIAIPIYKKVIKTLENTLKKEIGTGEFGADMKVQLTNDGPVTILIDTKNKE